MSRANPDKPSYAILMAIRAGQKIDSLFGQADNLASGRKHASVASRNRQAALKGLRKLERLERSR